MKTRSMLLQRIILTAIYVVLIFFVLMLIQVQSKRLFSKATPDRAMQKSSERS